jgi:hypothetical protein
MSTIGSATTAGLGLAGSVAGATGAEAGLDRTKAASADQKARVDQSDLLAQAMDDVADPEFGSDRDADGRLLYRRQARSNRASGGSAAQEQTNPRPLDAFGDRGGALDVDA